MYGCTCTNTLRIPRAPPSLHRNLRSLLFLLLQHQMRARAKGLGRPRPHSSITCRRAIVTAACASRFKNRRRSGENRRPRTSMGEPFSRLAAAVALSVTAPAPAPALTPTPSRLRYTAVLRLPVSHSNAVERNSSTTATPDAPKMRLHALYAPVVGTATSPRPDDAIVAYADPYATMCFSASGNSASRPRFTPTQKRSSALRFPMKRWNASRDSRRLRACDHQWGRTVSYLATYDATSTDDAVRSALVSSSALPPRSCQTGLSAASRRSFRKQAVYCSWTIARSTTVKRTHYQQKILHRCTCRPTPHNSNQSSLRFQK